MKINSEYSLGGYTKIADPSFFGDAVDETGNPILDQDGNPIRKDQNIDFYAIAYQNTQTGHIIISYRGTDDQPEDLLNGWTLGAGSTSSPQGLMAIDFYKQVMPTAIRCYGLSTYSV